MSARPVGLKPARRTLEVIPGEGIHPFYFGMSLPDVLAAGQAWRIDSVTESTEFRSLEAVLSYRQKVVELAFYYRRADLVRETCLLGGLATYDAVARNGRRISGLSIPMVSALINDPLIEYDEPTIVDSIVTTRYFENASRTVHVFVNSDMPNLFWMESQDAYPEGWN
jgi:hypothetical protein